MKEEDSVCVMGWVRISGSNPNRKLRRFFLTLLGLSPKCFLIYFLFGVEPEIRTLPITYSEFFSFGWH